MLQRQLSHLNGRKLDRRQVKPLIFLVSGFTLPYAANIVILMILCDLCLLPAQFCYIIVYLRKVERRVQIADRCASWKICNGAEALQSSYVTAARTAWLTPFRSFSIVACVFVTAETSLPCSPLATAVSSGSTILALNKNATVFHRNSGARKGGPCWGTANKHVSDATNT
jgi:hypothetical protein